MTTLCPYRGGDAVEVLLELATQPGLDRRQGQVVVLPPTNERRPLGLCTPTRSQPS